MAEDQAGDARTEAHFQNVNRAIRYAQGDERAFWLEAGNPDHRIGASLVDQVAFPPVLNEVACLEKGLSALSEAIDLLEQDLKEVLRPLPDEPGGPDHLTPAAASPLVQKLSLANESLAMQMGRLHMLRHRLTV